MSDIWFSTYTGHPSSGDRDRRAWPNKSHGAGILKNQTKISGTFQVSAGADHSPNRVVSNCEDYSLAKEDPVERPSNVLPLPRPGDSASLLLSKLQALKEVVLRHQSIAAATNYAAVVMQERDSTKNAIEQMPESELEAWELYAAGKYVLPTIDWNSNRDAIPTSQKALKSARRRAEALNYLYQTDQAGPAHSVWFTRCHPSHLPLIKAMARVIGTERNITGGNCLTATQLADLQSINKILSLSGQMVLGMAQPPDITMAQQVLGSRREELRALIVGRSKKRKVTLDH